jgi:glycine/D-amino acid oxidase-like deaminating enzyme
MGALQIVVVGGGALGLSCALHLVERGVAVTVIEAKALLVVQLSGPLASSGLNA